MLLYNKLFKKKQWNLHCKCKWFYIFNFSGYFEKKHYIWTSK